MRRTGCMRILSARWASTVWPLSSCTLHIPLGAGSDTLPSTLVTWLFSVNVLFIGLSALQPALSGTFLPAWQRGHQTVIIAQNYGKVKISGPLVVIATVCSKWT